MLLKDAKRGAIATIIRRIEGLDHDMKPELSKHSSEEYEDEGAEICCAEIIEAIEMKDPKMLKEALSAFLEMALKED